MSPSVLMHKFDPGYVTAPFDELVARYPGDDVYPSADFRSEWGPIFHRGRLDGSARILLIGQDPAAHEAYVRRILVGEAGQRIQGFLTKLGIDTRYVFINTFLYSVFGQGGGEHHNHDPKIAEYRNEWIDAILAPGGIEAVVTLGHLADDAFTQWKNAQTTAPTIEHVPLLHPTYPDSASRTGSITFSEAMKKLCDSWNAGLDQLKGKITTESSPGPKYGTTITDAEHTPIPEMDLPAGLPAWTRSLDAWASRGDPKPTQLDPDKRAILRVAIPKPDRVWAP